MDTLDTADSQHSDLEDESVVKPMKRRSGQIIESGSEPDKESDSESGAAERKPKRPRWTNEQRSIISKYFGNKIRIAPSRQKSKKMYEQEPLLKARPFSSVCIYIHNQLKKK